MNIEIGFNSENPLNPDIDRFVIEGNPKYIIDIYRSILEWNENFLPLWMEKISAFPIYFCAEINSDWLDEYEDTCRNMNMNFSYLSTGRRFSVIITEVKTMAQLKKIFPYFITIGCANELVLWSTNQNVFRIEPGKKKGFFKEFVANTVVVNMENNATVFWIGYDGDFLSVFSNHESFSTYENLCSTLPSFVNPSLIEYASNNETFNN